MHPVLVASNLARSLRKNVSGRRSYHAAKTLAKRPTPAGVGSQKDSAGFFGDSMAFGLSTGREMMHPSVEGTAASKTSLNPFHSLAKRPDCKTSHYPS